MIEQDVKKLEEIAKKLEEGTSLDESLKLYEEGCKLAKNCLQELEKAKGKIVMIKKEFNKKEEDNENGEQ